MVHGKPVQGFKVVQHWWKELLKSEFGWVNPDAGSFTMPGQVMVISYDGKTAAFVAATLRLQGIVSYSIMGGLPGMLQDCEGCGRWKRDDWVLVD